MAQLQQVMLRQMSSQEKEKGEDASPEAVKPGTSSLPALPQVHAITSSIDIADWLEMLAAPMTFFFRRFFYLVAKDSAESR